MIGILCYDDSPFDYDALAQVLTGHGLECCRLDPDGLTPALLKECRVLINAMGSLYPDEGLALLVDFFDGGKDIINLGAAPFTRNASTGQRNIRALRSFAVVDDFRPIEAGCTCLKTITGETFPAQLDNLQGAVYHLTERPQPGQTIRTAYLQHILDAYDDKDELVAAPIIRVTTLNKGSLCFWNFAFHTDMLQTAFWEKLLIEEIQKSLLGNVQLLVDSNYARYYPGENISLSVTLRNLTLQPSTPLTLTVDVCNAEGYSAFHLQQQVTAPFEEVFSPTLSASSLYKVTVSVSHRDILLHQKETGFLVLSEEEALAELKQFHPLYIDTSVSTDYCLTDGEPTAILGTTYFVTDSYRECFYNMNAWLCHREMNQLHRLGFNVLRSGNWVYIPAFYEEDGSIGERGKRALQTYFLTAARNGFTVQFVLGNVLLNQWDLSRSPIHNVDMRRKCMRLVASFAEAFQHYPNVTLDIVNEPSYSHKGAWSPGKPSEEPEELLCYQKWLQQKYGTIHCLRNAWGESAGSIRDFTDVKMPEAKLFARGLYRTEQRWNHLPLADFFQFARHEFLDWTREVRETAKKHAPNMTVIMGRDETLRIPAQQDELLYGNIDMICWHQWHCNSDILTEYLLNKVRGNLCIAQELGMYKFDDICAGKRHSDEEMATKLFRKLLYSFGNFVQWQAHDDPYMFELSENALGLYRADLSPTPSVAMTKHLMAVEKSMQKYMRGRQEDQVKIATLHNTSYYFSVDNPLAQQGIRNHVYALCHCLKEQTDLILEHLFHRDHAAIIGNPQLIILPAMQTLSQSAWRELLEYVKNGAVVLVSGCIDKDEFYHDDAKIGALDSTYTTRKVSNFEQIIIDNVPYVLEFRPIVGYSDVTNLLNCGETVQKNQLTEYPLGKGYILYCPFPLELSANTEAICACYRYAIQRANAQNLMYQVLTQNPQIVFHAIPYEACTVYTIINEGFADTISWTDLRSGSTFTIQVDTDSGKKLWISPTGEILKQI